MADTAADLELELRQQLQEQLESLASINEVLQSGHDDDLLAVKQQLEEAIPALQQSLLDLQQHMEADEAPAEASHQGELHIQRSPHAKAAPDWLQTGARCRFRYTNGQWHHGIIEAWQPDESLPVTVQFMHPTRAYMLESVQLPAGLVLPAVAAAAGSQAAAANGSNNSGSSSNIQQLSIGSRVLVLPPGQLLWQQAELTAISSGSSSSSSPAAAPASAAAAGGHQSNGSCTVTVVDTGQSIVVPLSSVALASAAAVLSSELDSPTNVEAATATAAGRVAAAADLDIDSENSGSSADESDTCEIAAAAAASERTGDSDSEQSEVEGEGFAIVGLSTSVLDHARAAAEAGVQQETATFADWEHHGRGIASRLMAKMGFSRGGGLGKSGAGISSALEISILPTKKGLGSVPQDKHHKAHGTSNSKRNPKRNRGGERTRRRKAAAARHAAKAAHADRQQQMDVTTGTEGIFAFINTNLGSASEAVGKLREAGLYGTEQQQRTQTAGAAALSSATSAAGHQQNHTTGNQRQQQQIPDRKGLVDSQRDLAASKALVSQLTAMLDRNKANRGLVPQIQAKLTAAKQQLEVASTQHRQMHKAVAGKEATEKWMKF